MSIFLPRIIIISLSFLFFSHATSAAVTFEIITGSSFVGQTTGPTNDIYWEGGTNDSPLTDFYASGTNGLNTIGSSSNFKVYDNSTNFNFQYEGFVIGNHATFNSPIIIGDNTITDSLRDTEIILQGLPDGLTGNIQTPDGTGNIVTFLGNNTLTYTNRLVDDPNFSHNFNSINAFYITAEQDPATIFNSANSSIFASPNLALTPNIDPQRLIAHFEYLKTQVAPGWKVITFELFNLTSLTKNPLVSPDIFSIATVNTVSYDEGAIPAIPENAAYTSTINSGLVNIIDLDTNELAGAITPNAALGIVGDIEFSPDGSTGYFSNNATPGAVTAVDTSDNSIITSITVGSSPIGMVVTPDGSKLYVANLSSDDVSVIDTNTNTVTTTISVGADPIDFAITPDGTKLYVVHRFSNFLSVIDASTDTVQTTITIGQNPFGIAISPDGSTIYVVNQSDDNVSVIDTTTDNVVNTIAVSDNPLGIAITPDGTRVLVANQGTDNVSIIDTSLGTVINTLPVGDQPLDIAISDDSTTAYVTNTAFFDETISIIDIPSNTVSSPLNIGVRPNRIEIVPKLQASVSGAIVKVEFEGTVSGFITGELSGNGISIGDKYSGFVKYKTDAPLDPNPPSNSATFYTDGILEFEVTINGFSWRNNPSAGSIRVQNDICNPLCRDQFHLPNIYHR